MLTEGISACLELLGIITRQPFLEASVRVQAAQDPKLGLTGLAAVQPPSRLTASPTPPQACLETLTKPKT
jgi:hypothetical protein